ncbi:MAG TPA: PAS domain S-box protein [Thermoanaerobaculia bacterium]|nr:PAS domain S-box protein [Thermoanaerobaculia bacterium]
MWSDFGGLFETMQSGGLGSGFLECLAAIGAAGAGPAVRVPSLVLALATVAVLALLAFGVSRLERRRSLRALADQLRFERLISEISARLIAVDAEHVNQAVEAALRSVVDAIELDRCSLFVFLPEQGEARATHAADVSGLAALGEPLRVSEAPGLFRRLRAGETIALADVARDLPATSRGRKSAAARGLRSLLLIPITVSDGLVRGIEFQTTRRLRSWPADLVPRLRVIGEMLTSAVAGKRAEAALRESEKRYREIVDSQTDLICRFLPDTTLTFVNEAYARYFGGASESLVGRSFLDLIPEPAQAVTRTQVESLVREPRAETHEHEVVRADGSLGWNQWTNYPVRGRDGRVLEFQAIGRDITDRKRAEEADRRMDQASRLELLGELTASIAHEINQPLGAILSNADALDIRLEMGPVAPDEIRSILSDIRREDLRASEVIRRVRALVRRRVATMQALDVNGVVQDALGLAEPECRRRGVTLRTELASGLPAVRGDGVSLQQVLLNLIVNGMDAMSAVPAGGRRLLLSTGGDGDGGVELAVTDAGHGIAAELLPRLFDSFVTTREEGMGLGLSISRSIVEAHGGSIRATNNDGGGATLRVTLPIAAA